MRMNLSPADARRCANNRSRVAYDTAMRDGLGEMAAQDKAREAYNAEMNYFENG